MRTFAVLLFILAGTMAKAQPFADVIEYINTYKQLAMDEMKRTGIPAAIKLAQGIHETYAGKSELVLKSNNHFGIKCKAYWMGKKVYHDDDARGECFRSYADAADSYRDHSDFLKSSDRYASLFALDPTDYKAWALGLKKAGYATNPNYAPILIGLIEQYNLQQYSLIALGKLSPADEVMAQAPLSPGQIPPLESLQEPVEEIPMPPSATRYPSGEFQIDNTKVIFAKQGTSLLAVAREYDIPLHRLLEFNNIQGEEVLLKDQLLYLQKKKKSDARPKL